MAHPSPDRPKHQELVALATELDGITCESCGEPTEYDGARWCLLCRIYLEDSTSGIFDETYCRESELAADLEADEEHKEKL